MNNLLENSYSSVITHPEQDEGSIKPSQNRILNYFISPAPQSIFRKDDSTNHPTYKYQNISWSWDHKFWELIAYALIENYNISKTVNVFDKFNNFVAHEQEKYDYEPSTYISSEYFLDCISLTDSFNEIIDTIKSFSKLEANWDSYGALPVTWNSISSSINLLSKIIVAAKENNIKNIPIPFVSPLPNGLIEFEWESIYKELIFSISENEYFIDFLLIDRTNSEENEFQDRFSETDFINLVINWFLS